MSVTARNGAERVRQHRARKLADIPKRIFDAVLEEGDPHRAPSEAQILRRAGEVEERLRRKGVDL